MRNFHIYSLIVMVLSAAITWSAIAMPVKKVHVLDNLTAQEATLAKKIISETHYKISEKPMFTESHETLIITKVLGNESEPASILLEIVHQEDAKSLPKSIFKRTVETKNISEALKQLPDPDKLKQTLIEFKNESLPVAFQN